ncbi:MAG TPA: excinuclease ABC subunit UvrA, partial [Candidatus Dojkabacteria bacterium]
MQEQFIKVRGARQHNLKNVDLDIPKNKLVVFTGVSGSGKSSLAFDTIYAEGQRRYVESLSSYARQFLGMMKKPDVDFIEGLSPSISIDQKSTSHNPRSTVGTVTEIYDYLRLLYARVGHSRSPISGRRLEKQTVQQIVDKILDYPKTFKLEQVKIIVLSPIVKSRKGTYEELFSRLLSQGYARVRVDGQIFSLEEDITLDRYVKHDIEVVIDRLVIKTDSKDEENVVKRLTDSIELALNLADGEMYLNLVDFKELGTVNSIKIKQNGDIFYSEKLVDPETGESFPEIEPHSFSFNSPHGACPKCNGLGIIKELSQEKIYNSNLTILEGGIYPMHRIIDKEDSYMMRSLNAMAIEEKFSLKKPLADLTEEQLQLVLNGSKKTYKFTYTNFMGIEKTITRAFDGVIPWLMKRYAETDSEWVRSDVEQYMIENPCPVCLGFRLKHESLAVTILGINITDVGNLSIRDASKWITQVSEGSGASSSKFKTHVLKKLFNFDTINPSEDRLNEQELEIGKQVFKEISARLDFLLAVGLEYLSLNRTAKTLSGGESQRIRLASQIGTGLTGVLYVLDEPSIGLHQRDNERLIRTLENLRDIGNSVVIVEHDEDTILRSDYMVDIGPGAGEHGGEVVFTGQSKELIKNPGESLTGKYLSGKLKIDKSEILKQIKKLDILGELKNVRKYKDSEKILITNVQENNLKGFDFELPLGKFVCITGVSGSGKSSLVNDILVQAVAKEINKRKTTPGKYEKIYGIELIDKLVEIDQSPIGRTPRSNPATYTGIFTDIRNVFALTKEAKTRGYKPGRFSFNVKGGRCEKCQGAGVVQISMQFLPDVYVKCDLCKGKRYNRETLQIDYKGKNIAQVLDMTVEEGMKYFENINNIKSKLKTLNDVGLGYIRLGQAATTLSGGESQRVKLASELSKRSTGKT